MEVWFIIAVSLCVCFIIKAIHNSFFPTHSSSFNLPPGPRNIPIISSFLMRLKFHSELELEPLLRNLHAKHGLVVSLPLKSSRPAIFIRDRFLAHQALIQNGAIFSDRPQAIPTDKILSNNQLNIHTAFYGPTWRALRRNLTSEILHPSKLKSFSLVQKRVVETLLSKFQSDSELSKSVTVIDHFQDAMFGLLVFMCFGDDIDEKKIKQIQYVQHRYIINLYKYDYLNFWPRITKILLNKHWEDFLKPRKDQEVVFIPMIRERRKMRSNKTIKNQDDITICYLDTLLNFQLPEENRKLNESEIVALCSEFLTTASDTTSAAFQWLMANLVKYPHVQQRVVEEIKEAIGDREEKKIIKEEELEKLKYLKAVILEGLRRHPPVHFLVPHAVTKDVVFDNYLLPKNRTVNFMVAEMGWDPKVWEDPMDFKPERFMRIEKIDKSDEVFYDLTGRKEIKMMPFGVGRRMCPGYNMAMQTLEYFVANLIWNFEWKAANGGEVDLSEKQELMVVMKNPLQAQIAPRFYIFGQIPITLLEIFLIMLVLLKF